MPPLGAACVVFRMRLSSAAGRDHRMILATRACHSLRMRPERKAGFFIMDASLTQGCASLFGCFSLPRLAFPIGCVGLTRLALGSGFVSSSKACQLERMVPNVFGLPIMLDNAPNACNIIRMYRYSRAGHLTGMFLESAAGAEQWMIHLSLACPFLRIHHQSKACHYLRMCLPKEACHRNWIHPTLPGLPFGLDISDGNG